MKNLKKLLFGILFILNILNIAHAGTVSKYFTYQTNSEVNSTNLNGNLDNIITVFNGAIDNTNINTTAGYRLYEVLGVLPAAGTLGRTVFYTVDKTLNFDTGLEWYSAITLLRPPVQGDIVYYNGTNWVALPVGTSGYFLKTQGSGANPIWNNSINSFVATADWDIGSYELRAQTFESDVATGTAPLTIASTTKIDNLNADLLDGQNGAYYNLSNVIFSWSDGNATETGVSTVSTSYVTFLNFKFTKIAGISTITIQARLKSGSVDYTAYLSVDIGGASAEVTRTPATFAWVTSANIDVSGLTNGTTYDGVVQIKGTSGQTSVCSAVTLIAS